MAGAAVAGMLASAFVRIAIGKLGSAITGQASLLWNFGKNLEEMKDHLETISAVLEDAERQSVKEELVRLWLKRLKGAAIDISDMLEDYQDTSDQDNTKMPVLSCLPVAYKKIDVANRMKSLCEKLRKIEKEIYIFDFKKGSNTNNEQPFDERETTSYFPEEPVGRDGEKQEIISLLSANTINDDIVIVAIYGLGGIGKSTLAQLVYNDAQFIKNYDYHIWVYVSQDFNLNKIGSSIICQLPTQGELYMGTQQQVMKQHLDKLLYGKTVLVVLDDLWEENMTKLGKLRMMLHVKGSKVHVVVTTRKKEIAMEVSTSKPYNLQSLEDDQCWEIIKRSSQFEHKSNQEKMEQVGMDIVKKCGGVPLAAQAVGFMLRSIDDLSGWTKINNSGIWNGSAEDCDVLPSLKLSYERMPPQLRICFSYCAIFPKGHNIIEDYLIQQWTALDFIEQSKGKECINKLLGMSFLQVSKLPSTSQEHAVRYTMHDLVHDLARLTMADELIAFDVAPQRNTYDNKYCRYLVLRKYDRTMKLANMPSKLRALCFSVSGELDIPSGAFSFAKCLRTLDFSECSSIMLPASIGRLKQLRCLNAPRMQNESLPKCITELSRLQYLNINGSSKIIEIPESIVNLGCVKYLGLSGCSGISKLPESFGDLKCMVHLDISGCSGLIELPDSIGNLTHLQHLDLSGCSSLKALSESLCGLIQLQYLNLSSCSCLEWLPKGIGSLVGIQHLYMSNCKEIRELPESVMKLQSLSHLNLSGCRSMRGDHSLACLRGLTALQHLDISYHYYGSHDDFGDLSNNLKYLSLRAYGLHYCDFIATLSNLEHLDLSHNNSLAMLPESVGNLKRLHTLDLSYCYNLYFLPYSICTLGLKSLLLEGCSDALLDQASSLVNYLQRLPIFNVRADEVNGCSNLHLLEGINASELRIFSLENVRSLEETTKVKLLDKHNLSELSLAWSTKHGVQFLDDQDLLGQLMPPRGLKSMRLKGYSCISFPGWLMCVYSHLPNLVSIQLHDMPTCSNLPPLGQLPHLKNLGLSQLHGIKRIDMEFCGGKGAFYRLSYFSITDMKGLEEWNTTYSVEDGVEEFMFPVLETLKIANCPRLRLKPCPPTFRDCSIGRSKQVIYSLEEAVDNISQISLPSSRAIKLSLFMERHSCQSIRIFHHFPALQELSIHKYELTSLPESMRHLTCLEWLTLRCCYRISALPEWLEDLSSLKGLVISVCPGIKSLPSCIQHLPKLQKLEISYNQELKKWCESEENKTKLAHINIIKGGDSGSKRPKFEQDGAGDIVIEPHLTEDKPARIDQESSSSSNRDAEASTSTSRVYE